MSEEFGREYWEERYRHHTGTHPGPPNPHLLSETADLAPGTALDAGCGRGANAVWLAGHGWRVTAVDIAATALRDAREHAETLGADVADRIEWVRADLTGWTPPAEHFDLVTAHYVHPAGPRGELIGRLAAAVAPGGTLLVVDHHPAGPEHSSAPEVHVAAEQVAADLDPDRWEVLVTDDRTRAVAGPHGQGAHGHGAHDHGAHGHGAHGQGAHGHGRTLRDAVLLARRRP